MNHRWDCPDEYEARRKADRDASYDARNMGDWGPFYRSPYECDEANDAYRREYNSRYEQEQEEIASERRAANYRREEREREEYEMQQQWEADQQFRDEQRQQEEEYYRQQADQSDPRTEPENQPENIR